MKAYAYWWGVQLVPESEEDEKALKVVEKAEYAAGYDSPAGSDEAIQRVTPAEAARMKLYDDKGVIISR